MTQSNWFCTDDLKKVVAAANPEKAIFLVPMHPLQDNGLVCYVSSSDELYLVPCRVVQERYKLEENYKLELKPIYPGFANESYYQLDLASMIRSGAAEVIDQTQPTPELKLFRAPKASPADKVRPSRWTTLFGPTRGLLKLLAS